MNEDHEDGLVGSVGSVLLPVVRRLLTDTSLLIELQMSPVIPKSKVRDALINDVKQQFPSCGYTMMAGHRGYRVQQIRVRAALVRADPDGGVYGHHKV